VKNQRSVARAKARTKLLESVLKARGYRYGIHRIQAEADLEYMEKFDEWVKFVYLSQRHLDRKVKELVATGIVAALKSPPRNIKGHIERAVKAGATREEAIEVIELAGYWGGTVVQANALEAWRLQFAPELPGVHEAAGTK
jgi:alkylhydroperoxidase/carboxymuconolactone decarboxylase family protein YurZ